MRRPLTCLVACSLVACGSSPALRAAEQGDRLGLSAAIADRERAGRLDNQEAARLAEAVASRDLRDVVAADAPARVAAAGTCARALDGALAERMTKPDAAGAQAAIERLDAGTLDPANVRRHATDADGAWRAAGARSLVRAEDAPARRRAFEDPDPRVRRQAMRAAAEARDEADAPALLEAARLDPEPRVRTEALRALTQRGPAPREAAALADLWPRADEGLREDIAIAWSSPALWGAGGREALEARVAAGGGAGVTEGALAILRHEGGDPEARGFALSHLLRSIAEGPRPRRLQAIAGAPVDHPGVRHALEQAAGDPDLEVRVGALERLAEAGAKDAVAALEGLASPGSPVAARARFSLAVLHDRRVQAWIEEDLRSGDVPSRLGAADSLAALGVEARAAPLLADAEATVRIRAACVILDASRRR